MICVQTDEQNQGIVLTYFTPAAFAAISSDESNGVALRVGDEQDCTSWTWYARQAGPRFGSLGVLPKNTMFLLGIVIRLKRRERPCSQAVFVNGTSGAPAGAATK